MTRAIALSTLAIFAISCSAVVHDDDTDITGDPNSTLIAIVNVNVVPMDQEGVIPSQTVLIDDGRITAIGPASSTQVPKGALRIDANGKYLLPGLIDMHVHIRSSELEKYLQAGVTSVRNMWGYVELAPIIRDIESGARSGPQIFSLTSGFDASPPQWPQTQISDEPAQLATLIDRQRDLGFREIKVYQKLSRAAYDTIVAVAGRRGMTFAGHMPTLVGLTRVLEAGQRSIEHLGGYSSGSQLSAQVAATVQRGTYNCPTIAVQALIAPAKLADIHSITRALHNGGAPLLVGTDAGIDLTEAGASIHDELEHFVTAGLSPFNALLGATRTAAEYLGQSAVIGTVAAGKTADLILVRGNPLDDIGSTRNIEAVIVNGKLLQ